jgi:hypothetical protein
MRRRSVERRRVHKSTGGISKAIPESVDFVDSAPGPKINTAAFGIPFIIIEPCII